MSVKLDYQCQSVFNVLPLILARTTETKEAYAEMFTNLRQEIERVLKEGIMYDDIKYLVEFVWTSDLHTLWLISDDIFSPPGSTCQFCPYCKATWMNRINLRIECRETWKNKVSGELNNPWKHFVFCALHADCRGTEKLLELSFATLYNLCMYISFFEF